MPTPLDILLDPVSLMVLCLYASLMLWEAIAPGRKLPKIKHWRLRGISVFIFYFYFTSYLPLIWDSFFASYQLINLTDYSLVLQVFIGVVLYQLGIYIWHRLLHENNMLWKIFHQMHHSAERIDTYGAFYFSPFDMIGFSLLGSLCLVLVVGLSPQATTVSLLLITFLGVFQHTNIKTPVWLGYIVQRPESHTIHHAKGIHAYNYSDLPIFDIIFGTFKNPKNYEYDTGFYSGASKRIWEMILFKNVEKNTFDN
jgi:sterol desaturase/sphingolipid hydroxylase (fatty acid hydroxylase superfamily)